MPTASNYSKNKLSKLEQEHVIMFHDEIYYPGNGVIPVTVAMCSCGRNWKTRVANLYLYDQESWENAMQFHFTKEHEVN